MDVKIKCLFRLPMKVTSFKGLCVACVIFIGPKSTNYYILFVCNVTCRLCFFGGLLFDRTPTTFLNFDGFILHSQLAFNGGEQSEPFKLFDPSGCETFTYITVAPIAIV